MNAPKTVSVKVSASTANLGPGFDCLAMALQLWNKIEASLADRPSVSIRGIGSDTLKKDQSNLIYKTMDTVRSQLAIKDMYFKIKCTNSIPLGKGLGSSSAAIVGGLISANHLFGSPYSTNQLLQMASDIEGHPDNVAAALLGGCQIVTKQHDQLITSPIPVPRKLTCVLFVPETTLSTNFSRGKLPKRIPMEDAVFNLGRVALLVNSFNQSHLDLIATATEDKLHQPIRSKLFPAFKYITEAAKKAGALGALLSGGGPTVLAFTTDREMTIGYEMADAAKVLGISGQIMMLKPNIKGPKIRVR